MSLKIVGRSHEAADLGIGKRRSSLATRLTVWYTFLSFAVVVLVTLFSYGALVSNINRQVDDYLCDASNRVEAIVRSLPSSKGDLRTEVEVEPTVSNATKLYFRILDSSESVISETPGFGKIASQATLPKASEANPKISPHDIHLINNKVFRIMSMYVKLENTKDAGKSSEYVIQTTYDRKPEMRILKEYRNHLWYVLGLAFFVCVLVGYVIARYGLRPINQITEAAKGIRSTSLDKRLSLEGMPSEIRDLGLTFNDMLNRLEDSFTRAAQFSSNIAHELRTPINNMRGELEVELGKPRTVDEYERVLASMLEECVRLSKIVEQLLFIARSEGLQPNIERTQVDLKKELAAISEFYNVSATEAGLRINLEASVTEPASLNRDLFQSAVGNLISNSIAHSSNGGAITIKASRHESGLNIVVSDTGSGIPSEHLPYVFDRFYRVDSGRSAKRGGLGLGLSIVRSIVQLHQGAVRIKSTEGVGTEITLNFPHAFMPN